MGLTLDQVCEMTLAESLDWVSLVPGAMPEGQLREFLTQHGVTALEAPAT